ncbi:Hypothetical predicted protein [Paramuricea clavata]|uniref:Uncharacterized protein n=1 Tax=Paramuricea clavata TaxID=317549 RepID=A0A7D9L110_PARCT|nr:Hypothetical predicted protein [Paramuricea clavata]
MADSSNFVSSTKFHQNIPKIWNAKEICNHIASSNLSYDSKRIKWIGTFDILQKFVECDLKLDGKWSSPGGCSKKFTCYNLDISITWYPKKLNTLVFHGEESSGLVDALINVCAEAISEDDGLSNNVCVSAIHSSIATINPVVDEPEQMSNHCIKDFEQTDNHQKVSIEHDFKLGCQCRILAADLEGVKLDIAIMCRDIETKFLAAFNSRDSDSEQISELKRELLKEKEKCSQLEADISILVRGRNREINELKNTITCLENKLKSSDVINESLRQSLMQINSEKFNGVLSAEQSLSNQPEQINTYNCIIDTVKSIETANSNLGICLPASCNRNNNKLDNKCEINKVKLTEHNMNNDKISKAKVSRSYSRRNLNSPPYCEPLSLKSLGNLPLIEISKPCITQKKEPFLENPSNILNDSTTSTEMHVCIGQIPADISEFIVLDGDECMSECDNTNNCPFRQSFPERPPPLPHVRRAEWLAHLNLVRRLTAK